MTRKTLLLQSATAAWPICLGYIPIGLALGVLAQKTGLGPLHVFLMSVLVFAGSAQFIAVAMLGSGASPLAIVATTFIVNIRHLLMSSALAPYLNGVHRGKLSLMSYGITDESFVVNMTQFRKGGWSVEQAIVTNQIANATWILSTVIGALVGQVVPVDGYGIDFALPGMFIALLVLQLADHRHLIAATVAGVVAVCWKMLVPGGSYMIVASLIGATAGFWALRRSATCS